MSSGEVSKIRALYMELKSSKLEAFPKPGETLRAPNEHGVYIVYSPRGAVLHVGRTLHGKRGLKQRLTNHLHGASSFTIQFFNGKGSRLRSNYRFAYLEVANARTRALLESYAVGHLCPKHLGVGENTD